MKFVLTTVLRKLIGSFFFAGLARSFVAFSVKNVYTQAERNVFSSNSNQPYVICKYAFTYWDANVMDICKSYTESFLRHSA